MSSARSLLYYAAMESAKLTAIVPTFNEEVNIRDCLLSVSFADEVLVVDSFSTDRTLEIAQECGARIIQRDYENSASQKNWAIPQASCEWILLCDADERVTDELRLEILESIAGEPEHVGYSIPRANYFLGKRIRHCGWSPEQDRNIRLFMRDRSRYEEKQVHADVMCEGSIGRLKSPFLHYSFRTLEQYITKLNRYTTWGAGDVVNAGRRVGLLDLLLRPPVTFLKMFILRAGFLDGFRGLLLCLFSAFYTLSKYAKASLLLRGERQSEEPVGGSAEPNETSARQRAQDGPSD